MPRTTPGGTIIYEDQRDVEAERKANLATERQNKIVQSQDDARINSFRNLNGFEPTIGLRDHGGPNFSLTDEAKLALAPGG